MTLSAQEYEEALAYVKTKLALPKAKREQWLNGIVDKWIARRKAQKEVRCGEG